MMTRSSATFCLALPLMISLLNGCGGRGSPAIKAAPQTLNFQTAPALTLPGSATVQASASSGLVVSYSSLTPARCSVDAPSGQVTALALGDCVIAADQSGNTEFAPARQITQQLVIATNPNQTLIFSPPPQMHLFGHVTVSATASSGLPVRYGTSTPEICTITSDTGVVRNLAAGNCVITANQEGNAFYKAAAQVNQILNVPSWQGEITAPQPPVAVTAMLGEQANRVTLAFVGPASSGGSPISRYNVASIPAGISASGSASPITAACPGSCTGYRFTVSASNASGTSTASTVTDILTRYTVTAIFYEPDTQPNNTVFTGSFTLNTSASTVTHLSGRLSQSMTHINDGIAMESVPLTHQLATINNGQGGLLVTTFAQNTTDTFAEGGFKSGSQGLYFGYFSQPRALSPALGGVGNAYVSILIHPENPTLPPTQTHLNTLAYADCTALGMMGDVCMTGHYGGGTMGAYPVSLHIMKAQ